MFAGFFLNNLTLFNRTCKIFGMKKFVCSFLLLFIFICLQTNSADAYIEKNNAIIRIMNKAAGKVQTFSVPVNQTISFEKLSVLVRSCKQTDPFDAENFFSFIEITKADEGKIFSGWMNGNEPGKNPLQNADYDVWLVKCE